MNPHDCDGGRLTTHGLTAIGATLCEVRRDGEPIGRICRRTGRRFWEVQPAGWDGWTGDFPLMRDAVEALGSVTFRDERDGS